MALKVILANERALANGADIWPRLLFRVGEDVALKVILANERAVANGAEKWPPLLYLQRRGAGGAGELAAISAINR